MFIGQLGSPKYNYVIQAEDVLDFPSARVDIGSKLVWEYIGMPSRITTRVSYSLFSVVGSKVVS